jgi:Protein of unknown function (DUF4232)
VINIVPLGSGTHVSSIDLRDAQKVLMATAATGAFTGPASADPQTGPCDPQALTVDAGQQQSGLGHRAVQLNFTLQDRTAACQLSGYPTVDAEVNGAAPIHAAQTPNG